MSGPGYGGAPFDPLKVYADPTNYSMYLGLTFQTCGERGARTFQVVKANANLASAAGRGVAPAESSYGMVNFPTVSGKVRIAGVVPADISTVSSTAGQIDQSSVFCIEISGLSVQARKLSNYTTAANTRVMVDTTGAFIAYLESAANFEPIHLLTSATTETTAIFVQLP